MGGCFSKTVSGIVVNYANFPIQYIVFGGVEEEAVVKHTTTLNPQLDLGVEAQNASGKFKVSAY